MILIGTLREKEPQLLLKVPKDTTDSLMKRRIVMTESKGSEETRALND